MSLRTTASLTLTPLLMLAAGCGGSSSSADSSGPPALTKDQAAQVLQRFVATANRASHDLDDETLAAVEGSPQLTMDAAAYKLRRAAKYKPADVRYTKPSFYIPRLSGYPRWFAADVITGTGKDTLRHAMLFTQDKAGGPWLLTDDPYPTEATLGKVALGKDGYATALSPTATGLAMAPAKLGPAHAALLSGGPQAPGAAGLAAGPKTTQAYDALRQAEDQLGKGGVTLSSKFAPDASPVHALRTTDGGALVWYVVRQNEAYATPNRGRLAVTGDLVGLAPASSAKTRLDTTVLVQYLAAVPPKGKGPVAVTGMYRKAVEATGS
jgi:hypothetical protein